MLPYRIRSKLSSIHSIWVVVETDIRQFNSIQLFNTQTHTYQHINDRIIIKRYKFLFSLQTLYDVGCHSMAWHEEVVTEVIKIRL